jgi:hypothetical protein
VVDTARPGGYSASGPPKLLGALDSMQICIDNVAPDDVSKKSLKVHLH